MTDVPERDLADILKELRGRRSQVEFAHDVGISPGMIGHVEARRRSLSLESLTRIEDAHQLSDEQRAELRRARQRASTTLNARTREPTDDQVSWLLAELDRERSERRSEVQELRDQVEELIDQMAAIAEAVDVLRQQQGAGQSNPRAATE